MNYEFNMAGIQFPVPPKKIDISYKNQNKTITLINEGEVNLLKTPGLATIKFDLLLPMVQYPFARYPNAFHDATFYIDHLEFLKNSKLPFQLDIYRSYPEYNGKELTRNTQRTVSLETYTIKEDAEDVYDYIVSVELKTYKEHSAKTLELTEDGVTYKIQRPDSKLSTRVIEAREGDTMWSICQREYGHCDDEMINKLYKLNMPALGHEDDVDVMTYIETQEAWNDRGVTTRAQAAALIDKVSGGLSDNVAMASNEHWVTLQVLSLEKKKIITDVDLWLNNLDAPISVALLLALVDNWTGGIWKRYRDGEYEHWARGHLNTLCDKNIIQEPDKWENFEGQVYNINTKALVNRALMLYVTEKKIVPGQKLLINIDKK